MANSQIYTLSEDQIIAGGVACTVQRAAIGCGSSGDNTIVAANSTKKIRVISMLLVAEAAVDIQFKSGASTLLTGASGKVIELTEGAGFVLPENRSGWFQTATNEALVLNLSGAVDVSGCLTYIEVA